MAEETPQDLQRILELHDLDGFLGTPHCLVHADSPPGADGPVESHVLSSDDVWGSRLSHMIDDIIDAHANSMRAHDTRLARQAYDVANISSTPLTGFFWACRVSPCVLALSVVLHRIRYIGSSVTMFRIIAALRILDIDAIAVM